jgi:uncharacterized protein
MNQVKTFVKNHHLALFFVLAYIFSWGNYILSRTVPNFPFLFPFGPLLAALITAGIAGGLDGLKDLARRCLRWRVGLRWYAAALFVPAAIGLSTVYLATLLGGTELSAAKLGPWYSLFLMFPMALVDAPLMEETGWRGFALPRFPANRSPLFNTLMLALLVVGWHVPLVLFEGAIVAPYLTAGIASAVLTNWIYYNSRGSALLAMLYHTAANTFGLYFSPMFSGSDQVRYYWMLAAVNLVAAVVLVLLTGQTLKHNSGESKESVKVSNLSTTG